jgi:hypothetical protein
MRDKYRCWETNLLTGASMINWSMYHWILFSQALISRYDEPMSSLILTVYPNMGHVGQYVYQETTLF